MQGRKESKSKADLIELLFKLADICNISLIDYVIDYGCDDIDSFLSGMYRVRLKGLRNGQIIKKYLVIKWHPDPISRACFRESYKREFVFYQHVLPKLLEIQRSFKNIEGLKIKFPNCIFASAEHDKETIAVLALQDEFRLRDRLHKPDLEHVSLVMKNFAKLHGLSFVLEKTNPSEFEEIARLCHNDVQYSNPGPVPKCMRAYYDMSVDVVVDAVARDKLRQLAPDILNILNRCTKSEPSGYNTICHGDGWTNNTLFKYKGSRPVEMMFVDYQLMRLASPITDISYFLYMSTDREFLLKHYSHILTVYYGTLAAVLRHCNLNVQEVYPSSIFQKHLREYSVLGLIEALVSMFIITAPNEAALKLTAMKYENCDVMLHEDEYNHHSVFVERVNGVVTDFFERNYSLDAVLNE